MRRTIVLGNEIPERILAAAETHLELSAIHPNFAVPADCAGRSGQRRYDNRAPESVRVNGAASANRVDSRDGANGCEGLVKENPAGKAKKFLALWGATDILSAYTGQFGNLSRSTEGKGHVKQCSGGVGLHRGIAPAPLGPRKLRPPVAAPTLLAPGHRRRDGPQGRRNGHRGHSNLRLIPITASGSTTITRPRGLLFRSRGARRFVACHFPATAFVRRWQFV
jgi:hypothetical protein